MLGGCLAQALGEDGKYERELVWSVAWFANGVAHYIVCFLLIRSSERYETHLCFRRHPVAGRLLWAA